MKIHLLLSFRILVCLLGFGGSCFSQNLDTENAYTILTKSDSLFDTRNLERAIEEAQRALKLFKKSENNIGVIRCHTRLGYALILLGKLEEGKKNLDKSRHLLDDNDHHNSVEGADYYEALGRYYNTISDFDRALENYSRSVFIRKKKVPLNHLAIAENHLSMSVNAFLKSTYQIGEKHLDTVFQHLEKVDDDISDPLARYYANAAYMKHGAGHFKEAIPFYEKQIATYMESENPKKLGIANAYGNMGGAYLDLWNLKKGQECIEKSLEIFIDEEGENNFNVSHNYLNLARIFSRQGEGQKALDFNRRAIAINERLFSDRHYNIGLSYEALASTYSQLNDHENELKAYLKCLEIFSSIFGDNHKKIALLYEDLGRIKRKQGAIPESIQYLKTAIKIAKQIFESDNIILASMYQNLAKSYNLNNEFEKAGHLLHLTREIREKAYGTKHVLVAESRNAKAHYLNTIGDLENAIIEYDKVLMIYEPEVSGILNDFYVSYEFHLLKVLLQTMEGKAKSLLELYKKKGGSKNLELSIQLFQKAEAISRKMRQVVFDYKDRIWLSEYNKSIPEGGIEAAYLGFKHSQDHTYIEKAFGFVERSRANILRDFIKMGSSKNRTSGLEKKLAIENELKAARSVYISKIAEIQLEEEIDSSKLSLYKDRLFATNLKYDSLIKDLRKKNHSYFNLEYKKDSFELSGLQNFLNGKTTFLEFFKTDSVVYSFIVTKHDVTLQKAMVPNLEKDIHDLRKAIMDKDIHKYKTTAQHLYDELINPLAQHIIGSRLILSPHGNLWNIGFDILLTDATSSTNPKELPYLLKKYAISYANSASVLTKAQSGKQRNFPEQCLAFSYTNTDSLTYGQNINMATLRSTDEDLPGTRKEIKAISKVVNGQYYYGEQAKEIIFKRNVPMYSILHLALHGEVDHENPENSRLLFSNKRDTLEDNILYGHELFSLNVPAEMAVLSACNTGIGKVSSTEGIMSLGSAFQYAGTKSLLLTSWKVSDWTTPTIMEKFYIHLKNGMDKPTALQQAKLQYLKEADVFRAAPFYWASFYLVGDTSPIALENSNYLRYIFYFMLFLLLAIIIIWFSRERTI